MPRGGKREGAGAKPRTSSPTTMRGIRFTDEEWDQLNLEAKDLEISTSEYIRRKMLAFSCLDNLFKSIYKEKGPQ